MERITIKGLHWEVVAGELQVSPGIVHFLDREYVAEWYGLSQVMVFNEIEDSGMIVLRTDYKQHTIRMVYETGTLKLHDVPLVTISADGAIYVEKYELFQG